MVKAREKEREPKFALLYKLELKQHFDFSPNMYNFDDFLIDSKYLLSALYTV